jgi:hypothetical protein
MKARAEFRAVRDHNAKSCFSFRTAAPGRFFASGADQSSLWVTPDRTCRTNRSLDA